MSDEVVIVFSSFRSSELSSPSEVFFPLAANVRGRTMAFEAILDEVDQLHNVSARLGGLDGQHPPGVGGSGNEQSCGAEKTDEQRGERTDHQTPRVRCARVGRVADLERRIES